MSREEWVPFDFFAAVGAETTGGVALEESGDDGLGFGGHVGWELEWIGEDALVHHVDVFVVEGW